MSMASLILREAAEAMQKGIDKKLSPAIARQNHTARRARIAAGMFEDGVILQRLQRAMFMIADGLEENTLPHIMRNISTKKQIQLLLRYDNWDDNVEVFEVMLDLFRCNDHYKVARNYLLNQIDDEATNAERKRRELIVKKFDLIGVVPGFFPTPQPVGKRMIKYLPAGTKKVLDPSCGGGDILTHVKTAFPDIETIGVEVNFSLAEIARSAGHKIIQGDIFETQIERFDVIMCNPPFEQRADGDHIMYYFDELLNDGGTLIGICGAGIMTCNDKASLEFQAFVEEHGEAFKLPDNSFKESLTGVNTFMVVLHKGQTNVNKLTPDLIAEFLERNQLGDMEEYELVDFIETYLLTPDQAKYLLENKTNVEDMLNGRQSGKVSATCYEFYTDWNQKLGSKVFGF